MGITTDVKNISIEGAGCATSWTTGSPFALEARMSELYSSGQADTMSSTCVSKMPESIVGVKMTA